MVLMKCFSGTEEFFKMIECPVCTEFMLGEIVMCIQGHSICSTCKMKLQWCPLCRNSFAGGRRNFALETVFKNIALKCKNNVNGCEEYCFLEQVKSHQDACLYHKVQTMDTDDTDGTTDDKPTDGFIASEATDIQLDVKLTEFGATDEFLEAVECAKCLKIFTAEIHVCLKGHSVCCNCKAKMSRCPVCKDFLSQSRNFTLEYVVNNLTLTCINEVYGCYDIYFLPEIENHQQSCLYRHYDCLLDEKRECMWKGKKADILAHAIEQHNNRVLVGAENFDSVDLSDPRMDGKEYKIISAFDEIFYLEVFQISSKGLRYVSVHYIGPKENCSKYFYEVAYISKCKKHKVTYYTQTHRDSEDIEELFKIDECFCFNKKIARPLTVTGSDLTCSVKLYKV